MARREVDQEAEDFRAEITALGREFQEGLMEAGLLQSKQDRAQDGADIQSRLRGDNKEYQEDLESRMQAESQEAEALEDKFKVLDAKLRDAQD